MDKIFNPFIENLDFIGNTQSGVAETDPIWNAEKGSYSTTVQSALLYQSLEDQRLSTTDDVAFNSVNGGTLSGNNSGNQDLTVYDNHIANTGNPHDTSDVNLNTSDITTNNATTLKHGFLPKLSGSGTQFLNGQGNYSTISGTGVPSGYSEVAFTGQTSVNVIHNFGVKPLVQVLDDAGSPLVFVPLTITHNTDNDFTVSFDASTSGTIIASAGREVPNVTAISANYTILTNDNIIISTARNITITVPTAVGAVGKQYSIDNASTGNIIVVGTGGETIWGETQQVVPSQSTMVIYSEGANWRVT